jgi:hypothetical protein
MGSGTLCHGPVREVNGDISIDAPAARASRAGRLFKLSIDAAVLAKDLCRTEWDGYITARRKGLGGLGPVGNRQLQYDLVFMIRVLRWAVGTGRLVTNPWS